MSYRIDRVWPLPVAFLLPLLTTGCVLDRDGNDDPPPVIVSDGDYTPVEPTSPPGWPAIRWPSDNPYSPEKAVLGRRLFFDPVLSRTKDRACAWCHAPAAAFADPRRSAFSLGVGLGVTTRNSPVLVNLVYGDLFMWDGRSISLEDQALSPLLSPLEMDMTVQEVIDRLTADSVYVRFFRQAFGGSGITSQTVTQALATYQRTLISRDSPFDRWRAGDSTALSPAAKRGAALFSGGKAGCARCHAPPLFTDHGFHNIGLDAVTTDAGRSDITNNPSDAGKFKTPTLRNIAESNPYMHDGRFNSLQEVIEHYNRGGEPHANRDLRIRPLGLTPGEILDLTEFLHALTDSAFLLIPHFDPES